MPLKSRNEIELAQYISSKTLILRCPFANCHARIIVYSSSIPSVTLKEAPHCITTDSNNSSPTLNTSTTAFYRINDVWDFDNIGVSKPSKVLPEPVVVGTIGNIGDEDKQQQQQQKEKIDVERLLICSECDRGPLGFAGIAAGEDKDHKNLRYFLSEDSVLYDVGE
ncbi:Mss4 family protein [Candida parapsilosis]|uniref:Mss4-like protein n=2 Tax=Candida parapsilosis TaxID=5480 RepID=G8BG13_CANPC|nr:uncharacterized protein CPAR2_204400 [Candida parapsilosis]KAF6055055.1 Mss4 family protein [Candida parapsilosis]KAF6055922.1 Mss4 family protein [Candida parapsilosis]KAF6058852.1 Mss4 family protein [Candida parapsilosis]KAF6067609.1 Mss4 family protein [Candida parapsilosis]CAD1808333.1 unnamed protein product [Candida parapsilosis]